MKEKTKNLICGIIVVFPILIVPALVFGLPLIFDFSNHLTIYYLGSYIILIVGSSFLYALHETGKEHLEENPTGKIAKFFNKK